MQDAPLSFHDLSIGYHRHTVASHLSATLRQGTLTALIGHNGAGKSTLLRTLAALESPLGGTLSWAGRPVTDFSPRERAKTLSIVLTARPDTGMLTVREVVAMGRMPYTSLLGSLRQEDEDIVERSMEQAGIAPLAMRPLRSLSDGERQRSMIAKALAQDTPMILLDEPTSFLDFGGKVSILRLLHTLCESEGKTILLSTHDLELALRLTDDLWLMNGTDLIAGTPGTLAATGDLQRFFAADGLTLDAETLRLQVDARF